MGEYAPLVRRLGGQVVEIAPGSPSHIHPMAIPLDLDDDESPLSMKAAFLLSLCELVVGGKDGLQPIEKTVIDRCVRPVSYTHLDVYKRQTLNRLIKEIVVHERIDEDKTRHISIEIHFNLKPIPEVEQVTA